LLEFLDIRSSLNALNIGEVILFAVCYQQGSLDNTSTLDSSLFMTTIATLTSYWDSLPNFRSRYSLL